MTELVTRRLRLRHWKDSDSAAFAAMNADPQVMEFMLRVLSQEESDVSIQRIKNHFYTNGFGLWAFELRESQEFIGYTGLCYPRFWGWFEDLFLHLKKIHRTKF